jgi:hypothetical protein
MCELIMCKIDHFFIIASDAKFSSGQSHGTQPKRLRSSLIFASIPDYIVERFHAVSGVM